MVRVVFIAPFNMPVTMRFVSAVAELPDVQLALISQEPTEVLAPELRQRLAAHYRVQDALDVKLLAPAVQAVGKQLGILRLVLSEQFLLALPERGSARLAACVQKTRAFVLACVREGQDAGELRSDLPAETLAPIVMGTVQMLALSPSKARQRDAEARAVLGSLLALLRSPAVAPTSSRKSSP